MKSQIKAINRSRPVSKEAAAASARKINVSFGKLDATDEIGAEFCENKVGSEGGNVVWDLDEERDLVGLVAKKSNYYHFKIKYKQDFTESFWSIDVFERSVANGNGNYLLGSKLG